MDTGTLLVAIDLHAHAGELVSEAVSLAVPLGAELVLLHVMPVKPSVDLDVLVHPKAHPAAAASMRDEERAVVPALRELAAGVVAAGVSARLRIAHGDVVDAILEVAGEVGAGMILLGTHGRRGIARLALGSVAESVLRESPVPVLAIRGGGPAPHGRVAHHEIALGEEPVASSRS